MREGFKPTTAEDLIRMYDLNGLAKERKQIKQQNKEVSVLVKDLAETINEQIKELEDQVDGKISTWFFSGIPSAEKMPRDVTLGISAESRLKRSRSPKTPPFM